MYSSATTSSSASGLRAGGVLVGFGEGEAEEEGETAGEAEGFGLGVRAGFSEGAGEAFGRGLTGPVGLRGGANFGVGEGAAQAAQAARQSSSAKMWRGNLMGAASAPTLDDGLRVAKNFRMSDHRPRSGTIFCL